MLINRLVFVKVRLKYGFKFPKNKAGSYTLKSLLGFKIKIKKKKKIDTPRKY